MMRLSGQNMMRANLVESSQKKNIEILIDQGLGDNFLREQLKPELFEDACAKVEQKLNLSFARWI